MRHYDLSDKAMRRVLATLCILVAIAIVGLGIVIGSHIQNAATRARNQAAQVAINHLHAQAVLTCRRQNITRSTDNQAHLESYQLYQFLLTASKAHVAKDPPAERRAIRHLEHGQIGATWTPLIDCTAPHEAVRSLSLRPTPFSQRLPPPSALNPTNAARPDPTGSVS